MVLFLLAYILKYLSSIMFIKWKTSKQFVEEFGFRTVEPGTRTRFSNTYEDESWTLTDDLSVAEVKWQVQYIISNPKDYKFNLKDVESTIRDISEAVMRKIVGSRPFDKVIKEGRQSISSEAKTLMQEKLDNLSAGISIKNGSTSSSFASIYRNGCI